MPNLDPVREVEVQSKNPSEFKALRRGLALTVSALSVFFLLVSAAGIVAVWVINQPLTEDISRELAAAQADLGAGLANLQASRGELESLQGQVGFFQGVLDTLGTDAVQNTRLLSDVVNRVEGTISPLLERLSNGVDRIREAFESVKRAVEQLNELPLVAINLPGEELLDSITESLDSLEAQITETKEKVESVSQITEDTVDTLDSGFLTWEDFVQRNLEQLDEYERKIQAYQARLDYLEANIPRWVDAASIVLTLLLTWLAVSQIGMFVLAWSIYSGKDLLARWR
jgi:chromosome segregation ATPase